MPRPHLAAAAAATSIVRLTVEDAGPGVPDEALPRLFDKFYRVPGRRRRLAIRDRASAWRSPAAWSRRWAARSAARRSELGGLAIDIDLRRRPQLGSARVPARHDRSVRLGADRAGPTMLVVEDDDETRAALVRELRLRGYRADRGGRRALSALERWDDRRPDLVLLDLGLPDMDGLDVIRRIRREATTPIVILSGRYDEREKVEALERGADDYVTKPFGVDELNARLRVALRRAAGPAADASARITVGPLTLDPAATRCASPASAST